MDPLRISVKKYPIPLCFDEVLSHALWGLRMLDWARSLLEAKVYIRDREPDSLHFDRDN